MYRGWTDWVRKGVPNSWDSMCACPGPITCKLNDPLCKYFARWFTYLGKVRWSRSQIYIYGHRRKTFQFRLWMHVRRWRIKYFFLFWIARGHHQTCKQRLHNLRRLAAGWLILELFVLKWSVRPQVGENFLVFLGDFVQFVFIKCPLSTAVGSAVFTWQQAV